MRLSRSLFAAAVCLAFTSGNATAQAAPAGARPIVTGPGEIHGRIFRLSSSRNTRWIKAIENYRLRAMTITKQTAAGQIVAFLHEITLERFAQHDLMARPGLKLNA